MRYGAFGQQGEGMQPSLSNAKNQEITATQNSSPLRWLALGAIAGPILVDLVWIILGWLRPGYSPLRQQISDLGLGFTAPFMNAAFILSGLLLLVGVVGIFQGLRNDVGITARIICACLLALSPLGHIVVGIFTEATLAAHTAGAALGFLTPVVSFLVTGLVLRRNLYWRRIGNWLLLASPLTLVLVLVFFQFAPVNAPFAAAGLGGLAERAMAIQMHIWYVALGWLAFKRS